MSQPDLPTYDEFMLPVLETLKELGGSARRDEVIASVADRERLTPEQLEVSYDSRCRFA